MLLLGGPGVGKTYLANAIQKEALRYKITTSCIAATGVAASNLPNGRTIHNALGINPKDNIHEFVPKLKNDKKIQLQNRLRTTSLGLVIIDEVSAIGPQMMGQIEWRLRDIMEDLANTKDESYHQTLFGGLPILIMVSLNK